MVDIYLYLLFTLYLSHVWNKYIWYTRYIIYLMLIDGAGRPRYASVGAGSDHASFVNMVGVSVIDVSWVMF